MPVERLRNLGPVSARWLAAIGVTSADELRRMGAVEAFGRIRLREGRRSATLNLLYALHGALADQPWDEIPEAVKARLRDEAGVERR